jgi:hypothetical protein
MALGTVAIVRVRAGFPKMPAIPQRIVEMLSKHKLDETPDVILVAADYRMALDIAGSLRWGNVVGIAAETGPPDAPISAYPAVINVPGLLESVADDMLMIVDADQGIVIADPDGLAVAHYQAEHDKLAPKRRLFLDAAHLPAETVDGRAVLVLAHVATQADVSTALDCGADILYVPFDVPLLPAEVEDVEQRQRLIALLDQSSGKPLLIVDDYALPPMLLLEACLRADITLAEPPVAHLDGLGLAELAEELNEAQAECLANDAQCALPMLALYVGSNYALPLSDPEQLADTVSRWAARGTMRIVLGMDRDGDTLDEKNLLALDNLVAAANANMLPVYVNARELHWFEDEALNPGGRIRDRETAFQLMIGSGVSGLIVDPTQVEATKAAIRDLNFSECREALSNLLTHELS